ncbi:peroxiredoxin [mine drainage metagenome]|uniref:Peroxiredoxin n=1 Tax=mine drainage metagenome TaxID=410659 RepID=A0A1J5T926_9ZZZZ
MQTFFFSVISDISGLLKMVPILFSVMSASHPEAVVGENYCAPNSCPTDVVGESVPDSFVRVYSKRGIDEWLILFSHPADFTPVYTTEFMAFAKHYPEFQKLNCDLIRHQTYPLPRMFRSSMRQAMK